MPQVPVLYLGLGFLFLCLVLFSLRTLRPLWALRNSSSFSAFSFLCALCVPASVNGACPGPVGVLPSLFFSAHQPH